MYCTLLFIKFLGVFLSEDHPTFGWENVNKDLCDVKNNLTEKIWIRFLGSVNKKIYQYVLFYTEENAKICEIYIYGKFISNTSLYYSNCKNFII